ncbi:MAG: hypothetical protein B6244_13530 [Candidatus Cloacimonetes bacterium 4572_55]|nr:MAG: hypothetical protein B6244_13530 [Candidatus Cloacimonetes bacterium 4572_55]
MSFYTRVCIYLVLFLSIIAEGADAYPSNIRFERISIQDGLSQSSTNHIIQDKKGFLWFGTQDGLNRYDGYQFTVFRHDPMDSTSISDNFILNVRGGLFLFNSLIEDQSGNLWIATSNGLNRFDMETSVFHSYYHDPDDPHSISSNNPLHIYEDRQGMIWIKTISTDGVQLGIDRFDPKTEKFFRYRHDPDDSTSLVSDRTRLLCEDRDGNLWIGSNNGLCRYNRETDNFVCFVADSSDAGSVSSNDVLKILSDSGGRLWVGTMGGGLNLFHKDTQSFSAYRADPDDPNSLGGDSITNLYEDRSGNLWIGTADNGLSKFDPTTGKFTNYRHDPNDPNSIGDTAVLTMYEDQSGFLWIVVSHPGTLTGVDMLDPKTEKFTRFRYDPDNQFSLSSNFIISLYEDRSGVMWIGTGGAGVNKFSPSKEKFKRYEEDAGNPKGLGTYMIWSFFENDADVAWVGTAFGLYRFNRETEEFTGYFHDPQDSTTLGSNFIRDILQDQMGVLWVASNNNGLDRFNYLTGEIAHFRRIPGDSTSLSFNSISNLAKDSYDTLWVATNRGLSKYHSSTRTFTNYRHIPSDSTSLSSSSISVTYADRKGDLWVGSVSGLNKFNRETGHFKRYMSNPDDPTSLSHNNILCIYEDKAGNFWVGTWGGLNLLDRETGKFIPYTTRDGLPNDSIYNLSEDGHGNIWLMTNKGISCFDPAALTFRNYDVNDGLQSDEFNHGACYRNRRGEIYMGGVNGFNIFHPDSIKDDLNIPQISLTDFKVLNKSVRADPSSPHSILKKDITFSDQIVLDYKDRIFTFEFAALHFASPGKNQYAYMMEGFDLDWIYTDAKRRYATYTNLNGGDYVFRVKASNNDGVWDEEGIAVKVTVIPPFWKRGWFYFLEIISVLLLIAGLFLYQKKRYQEQMELRRKSDEIELAREVQLSMLPRKSISTDRIEVVGKMITATEVGGDYYDFIELPSHQINPNDSPGMNRLRYCIVAGDATGHGMAAGLFVGMVKMTSMYAIQAIRYQSKLNRLISDLNAAMMMSLTQRGMGMCLAISIIDLNKMVVELCSAGMPYPYHYRQVTKELIPLIMKGPPLGFFRKIDPQMTRAELDHDDVLIFLSDGFEERFNMEDDMWGEDRLERELLSICQKERSPDAIAERLISSCNNFAGGRPNNDDMTIVVARIR